MQHSSQPFAELDRARRAALAIRQANTLDELDEGWKALLHHLERVWNKALNHYGKSPKWSSWLAPYATTRKKDPLLTYLRHARGADEHSVNEITERKAGSVGISAGPSGAVFIRKLTTDANGEIDHLDYEGDAVITINPAKIGLRSVTNKGVLFNVPKRHLSRNIDSSNLLEIAELAVTYYEGLLNAAEDFFVAADERHGKKHQ